MTLQLPAVEVVTDRRRLLLGGGLVVGFALVSGAAHAATADSVAGPGFAGFAPNAFIRISRENQVFLIMPNVEMGQGTFTGECMLIAEELEVGLDQVQAVAAPPDEVRYKQPMLQQQATGGSTSIRGAWEPLRRAGATARVLLIQAAATRWSVDPATCRAERASVLHPPTGRTLTYGQLADAAARLTPPKQVALKDPAQFKLLGHPAPRVDTAAKVDGTAVYGIDIMVPGMKFATAAACPTLGGRLADVDDSAARMVPGFIQVVRLPNAVAVVGDHFWAAKQGLEALRITWDHGANADLTSEAIWADMEHSSVNGPAALAHSSGDFAKAFDGASKRIEAVYRQPFLCHAPMEPQAAVVHVTGGGAEIWCGTQVPSRAQAAAAKVIGVPPEKVVLHNQMIGGAFGRKLETDYVEQACAIAKQCPFPVKLVWTREEDMQHDNYRPMYLDRLSAGLDADGRPAAWSHRVTAASVMARYAPLGMRPNGVDPDAMDQIEDTVYGQFPNMLVDYVQWKPPPGLVVSWWRGVGATHGVFVVESFIDELAHAAGKDPLEYRRGLLAKSPRARAALDRAAQAAGWGTPLPARTGRGIIVQQSFGSFLAAVVEVFVSDEGDVTLKRITAAVDCGLTVNPTLVKQQIEGGLIFGLTAALHQEITLHAGRVRQSNFHDYRMLRIDETPTVEVIHMPTNNPPGGIGEAGTTAAAPALTNAVFAATGVRLRELPLRRELLRKRLKLPGAVLPPAIIAAAGAVARDLLADDPDTEDMA